MALLFALIALFGWGIGDVFVALNSRTIGAMPAIFWSSVVSLVLSLLYLPFAGGAADWQALIIACILQLVHIAGVVAYFKGLREGSVAIVGVASGLFSILTVFLAVVFFGEKLGLFSILGILFAGISILAISWRSGVGMGKNKNIVKMSLFYGLTSMATWGVYFTFIRIPAERIGWYWSSMVYYPLVIVILLLFPQVRTNPASVFRGKKKGLYFVFFNALLISIADYAYNLGILSGFTSLVAPVSGLFPIVFVILAGMVFKEKMTGLQKAGIVAGLVGIGMISVGS